MNFQLHPFYTSNRYLSVFLQSFEVCGSRNIRFDITLISHISKHFKTTSKSHLPPFLAPKSCPQIYRTYLQTSVFFGYVTVTPLHHGKCFLTNTNYIFFSSKITIHTPFTPFSPISQPLNQKLGQRSMSGRPINCPSNW